MSVADNDTKVVSLITKVQARSDSDIPALKVALVELMLAGGHLPDVYSSEIIPPVDADGLDWRMVLRFDTGGAEAFRQSADRVRVLQKLSSDETLTVSEEITDSIGTHGTVVTSIVTLVKPELEKEFFEWQYKTQLAQAKYEGYRGVYCQPPSPGAPHKWTILLRFDSPRNLQKWFDSEERLALVAEQEKLVHQTKIRQEFSSYPGWFPVDSDTGAQTQKWKTAMLILAALFPIVILEMRFLNPLLLGVNLALSVFLSLVISVSSTTWVLIPALIKLFSWWLAPGKSDSKALELKGLLLVLLLFAGELLIFWDFLIVQKIAAP